MKRLVLFGLIAFSIGVIAAAMPSPPKQPCCQAMISSNGMICCGIVKPGDNFCIIHKKGGPRPRE